MNREDKDLVRKIILAIPWWVYIILAVAAYVSVGIMLPAHLRSLPEARSICSFARGIAEGLAPVAISFAFPFMLLGLFTGARQWYMKRLLKEQRDINTIKALDWRTFEHLIGAFFKQRGYSVTMCGGAHPDGGIDLVASKNGEKIIIQCKHWKVYKVNVKIVREMYGVMVDQSASEVFIITSGDFTQDALDFAKDKPIKLINGVEVVKMISVAREAKEEPKQNLAPATPVVSVSPPALKKKYTEQDFLPPEMRASHVEAPTEFKDVMPLCPVCKIPMVLRIAESGAYSGSKFWGCSNFPQCRRIEKYKPD